MNFRVVKQSARSRPFRVPHHLIYRRFSKFHFYMTNNATKYTTIILPRECVGQEISPLLINLLHPRTEKCAKFLKYGDNLWELSSIDGSNAHRKRTPSEDVQISTRSLLFEADLAVSSPNVLVATPINPLYFVLPIVYTNSDKFLSADQIQDLSESRLPDDCQSVTADMFDHRLSHVCELLEAGDEKLYKFSQQRFISHIDSLAKRVSASIPVGMLEHQMDLLRPVDISKSIPQDMIDMCRDQLATHYICAYLSEALSEVYLSTKNYQSLESYKAQIRLEKKKLAEEQERLMENSIDNGQNQKRKAVGLPARSNGVKKQTGRAASLQKVNTKNNKSLMDMFRKTV
jgi:Ydr279p protein family (RNase H2 complex component) wHTH domain/Ydr279p protein triple barrel domain